MFEGAVAGNYEKQEWTWLDHNAFLEQDFVRYCNQLCCSLNIPLETNEINYLE